MNNGYYDGVKLLSMKDINGDTPEIFICTSNRSAGKTTYFARLCVNAFIKRKEKFMLVYRFNYELSECADKFFKDIRGLFFPGKILESKSRAKNTFHELYLDGESCGYAVALNAADQIKKYSHFFSDVSRMMFDEFQSETGHYCSREVEKLISIHVSVSRGQNKQVRYVPVYMISNPVTILNPYYVELGIADRLRDDTHFLKGEGFVLEQGFNDAAANAQRESAFNRAFRQNHYVAYAAESVYLSDNKAFVDKPEGFGSYLCTLKYEGQNYGIREYAESGIVYCDDRPDLSHPNKITVTTEDHNINYVMLKKSSVLVATMRYYFEHGAFRFKNLRCKEAVLKALQY